MITLTLFDREAETILELIEAARVHGDAAFTAALADSSKDTVAAFSTALHNTVLDGTVGATLRTALARPASETVVV